jgi:hypothetical protein
MSQNEGDAREVFSRIYSRGGWTGSKESISGRGSEVGTTEVFRKEFGNWLNLLPDVATLLDAPCGDFNWISHMPEVASRHYIGGDIVPDLISRNIQAHAQPRRDFRVLDIIDDPLPEADLWLCRDVLFHFPIELAVRVTQRCRSERIRYFLATTFPGRENDRSAPLGGYAPYNLEAAPFTLPPPVTLLNDPGENPRSGRKIGVWTSATAT